MDTFTASEWRYRAEGNKHIVVCNGRGSALRLQKKWGGVRTENGINNKKLICIGNKQNQFSNTKEFPELEFLSHIALPLLGGCLACHIPVKVELSDVFFTELHSLIEKDRPDFRGHKVLDPSKPSLLMQDHCYIPHSLIHKCYVASGLVLSQDNISVEIKLKRGFISDGDICPNPISREKMCNFCSTQLYRRYCKNRYKACSYYCPLDLFSGCPGRMKSALLSMIETPQNNIRIFQNGEVIHSQETIEANNEFYDVNSNHINLYKQLYHFFRSSNFKGVDSYGDVGVILTDIVIKSLLLKVIDSNSSAISVSSKSRVVCNGDKYKRNLSENVCGNLSSKPSNTNGYSNTQNLKPGCILDLILSVQKIWATDMTEIEKAYLIVKQPINCHRMHDAGLDSPYNTESWAKIKTQNNKPIKFKSSYDQALNLLQRFLISKSFCDCSVMVSIQPVVNSTLAKNFVKEEAPRKTVSPLCNLIEDRNGNLSLVYIAVVDTDPKPSSKIPQYIKINNDVKDWFASIR